MEYWKQTYYDLLGEVRELEEKIHGLDCTIYRADANQISLRRLGTLEYDDDFDYEGKSIEEKLVIAETIYIESIEECRELERKLRFKRMDLILISEAIIDEIINFMCYHCKAKITLAQRDIFDEEANEKIDNVRLLNL